jgi:hypothetical protein
MGKAPRSFGQHCTMSVKFEAFSFLPKDPLARQQIAYLY